MIVIVGPLLALLIIWFVMTWAHTHTADGRPPAVWNCGREDCKYRNRTNHRHPEVTP